MNEPSYIYIDTAEGGPEKRNKVVRADLFKPKAGGVDVYRTMYRFNQSYYDHWQSTGSVAGFRGECYSDYLFFDIDDSDLNIAYKKASDAIEILNLDYHVDVEYLYFSGAKGFHILLPVELFRVWQPSKDLPAIHKAIASDLLPGLYDSSIYETNRIFRVQNTINSKSGLYKIPLTLQEFRKGLEYIKELAKGPRVVKFRPGSDFPVNDQLKEIYQKYLNGYNRKQSEYFSHNNQVDNDVCSLIKNGVKSKENGGGLGRRPALMKIGGSLLAKGLDIDMVTIILKDWNRKNEPELTEQELEKCFESLRKYRKEKDVEMDFIKPVWAFADEYEKMVSSDQLVKLGIAKIDDSLRGIRPGQVCTILGFTGVMKTAVIQGFLSHYHKTTKKPVVLFELEMPGHEIFERAVQMEMGVDGYRVEQLFKSDDQDDKEQVKSCLIERLKDFYIVDRPGLTVDEMERILKTVEEKILKRKVGLVGVDFIQLVGGKDENQVQRINRVAIELKNMAKRANVPIISISQITPKDENTNDESEIILMQARDGKNIEISSDYVVGIWNEGDDYQVLKVLKNRRGKKVTVKRKVNRTCLQFQNVEDF